MKDSDTQALWAAVRSDFYAFVQMAFPVIYPNKELTDNWHIHAIIYCLEQSFRGKMPRLIVNLPPRHLKSFIVSVAWPAFVLGQDPSAKLICVSYADQLSQVLARDSRRLMECPWYAKVFTDVQITKSTENEIVTSQGGGRFATSVGGSLTGRGADFILVDDPAKAEDSNSDSLRNKTNQWFNTTLLSRLDDKARSVLVLVMQRLHVNDLTGYIQNTGGFHKLSFPAIALADEDICIGDGLTYRRIKGAPLCDELESLETLEKIRDQIGNHTFAAQYQQTPDAPEGALFKLQYLQFVDHYPVCAEGLYWISIDSAQSVSETADYSAFTVGYSFERRHYVLHAERGRFDYDQLLTLSMRWAKQLPIATFIVEAASSGLSLIQSLRNRGILVCPHHARQDKMTRACYALPVFSEGRVHILNRIGKNEWVEPFVNELLSFPNGRFDDQTDSLVQAIRWAEPRVNLSGNFYEL